MQNHKPPSGSSPARWRKLLAYIAAAVLAAGMLKERTTRMDAEWVQAHPEKVVWSSGGSAKILHDHSVELEASSNWQEVTLHYQPPELAQISRVLLEVLPSAESRARGDGRLMLFDVKPYLADDDQRKTPLEFQSCRFLGNEADDTAANCIDFLSDTGWTVPEFVGKDARHQLVLELREPISIQRNRLFAITVDSGGAPDLKPLARIRISFSGPSSFK